MNSSPWLHHVTLFALTTVLYTLSCRAFEMTSSSTLNCTFSLCNRDRFEEEVTPYLDKDSDVRIVEYVIRFNVTPTFDWSRHSVNDSFEPYKWYRMPLPQKNRLLLAFYYMYGLFRPLIMAETRSVQAVVNVHPQICLDNAHGGALTKALEDYLLTDFGIEPRGGRQTYSRSDEVNICSMYLENGAWEGSVKYRCCQNKNKVDNRRTKECRDVKDDNWMRCFRALVSVLIAVGCLYLPALLPGMHPMEEYEFIPSGKEPIKFNVVVTSDRSRRLYTESQAVITHYEYKQMPSFMSSIDDVEKDTIHEIHAKSIRCLVSKDRVLRKDQSPFTLRKYLDPFYLIRISHSSSLSDCCNTSVCGDWLCACCCSWTWCFRALRIFVIMAVLALPAIPFFYVMMSDNAQYRKLNQALQERRFNGLMILEKLPSRIVFGLLAVLYFANILFLAQNGSRVRRLIEMYRSTIRFSRDKNDLANAQQTSIGISNFSCVNMLKRVGILFAILFCLLAAILFPIYMIIRLIFTSPLGTVLFHTDYVYKKIYGNRKNHATLRSQFGEEKFLTCKLFLFRLTLTAFFVVFAIGLNVIAQLIIVLVIEYIGDPGMVYQALPALFFFPFYTHGAFTKFKDNYKQYLKIVFEKLKSDETNKTQTAVTAKRMIQFPSMSPSTDRNAPQENQNTQRPLFERHFSGLKIRLDRVFLFLTEKNVLGVSRKFFFHRCSRESYGVPGQLVKNVLKAVARFLKIAVFLTVAFIAVMAFGNAYSIPINARIIISIVIGIIPKLKEKFFHFKEKTELERETKRYTFQIDQSIDSYSEMWKIKDIEIESLLSVQANDRAAGVEADDSLPLLVVLTTTHVTFSDDGDDFREEERYGTISTQPLIKSYI